MGGGNGGPTLVPRAPGGEDADSDRVASAPGAVEGRSGVSRDHSATLVTGIPSG
jgi:hypothetical protein